MSILRGLLPKAVANSDSNSASDEDLPLFENSEKTNHVIGYVLSLPSKSWIRNRKLPFAIKLLVLTFVSAFTLFSGQSIINYATLGYNAILRSSKAHDHVTCSKNASVDAPIYIAAPPFEGIEVGARLLNNRGDWNLTCSSNTKDCRKMIGERGIGTPKMDYWQSEGSGRHLVEIELEKKYNIHGFAMEPGKDWANGGSVQKHRVEIAEDGAAKDKGKWDLVAYGTWRDDDKEKYATFEPRSAKFVRLVIVDSTKGKEFVAIGNISIYVVETIPPAVDEKGRWGITLNFPLVPVTAFLNPIDRNLITLASNNPDSFGPNKEESRHTVSAIWNRTKGIIEETTIEEKYHNIFCPGTSFDEKGEVMLTGGSTPNAVSFYNPKNGTWKHPQDGATGEKFELTIGRGYQGQTFLPNGKTFLIGGRWGVDDTDRVDRSGELYDNETGWKVLENVKASYIQMEPSRTECDPPSESHPCTVTAWQQHHPWLFAWKNGSIFHAGPSKEMHWIFPEKYPNGTDVKGGLVGKGVDRGNDSDAVCGITSMYDAEGGVILTAGGAPNYHYWFDGNNRGKNDPFRKEATRNAFEITLGKPGTILKLEKVASMNYQRIFANAVILPNGETLVVGGQKQGEPFFDETWRPVPEIYSPESKKWREVARHSTPRVYHSWAMLLPDATVIVGGGGLSTAAGHKNHFDAQIYKPAYLFTGVEQPNIKTDKLQYKVGEKIIITADVKVNGSNASLIRYSAATHGLNNDLRRIKLTLALEGNVADKKYSVKIPDDEGVTLPGYWMLFVLHKGVPSHAATVQILKKS